MARNLGWVGVVRLGGGGLVENPTHHSPRCAPLLLAGLILDRLHVGGAYAPLGMDVDVSLSVSLSEQIFCDVCFGATCSSLFFACRGLIACYVCHKIEPGCNLGVYLLDTLTIPPVAHPIAYSIRAGWQRQVDRPISKTSTGDGCALLQLLA